MSMPSVFQMDLLTDGVATVLPKPNSLTFRSLFQSITQYSLTYTAAHFSNESKQYRHKLSRHADFTSSNDFVHTYLAFFTRLQCFDAVGWAAGRASGL